MSNSLSQPLSSTWRAIWIWFYLAILLLGLIMPSDMLVTIIKLGSILGCLIYVYLAFRKDCLLQLAFLFTLIADILLAIGTTTTIIFFGNFGVMELGVIVFFCAQITHFYRLTNTKPFIILSIIAAFLLSTIATVLLNLCPPIIVICVFYITMLITNIVVSARWVRREPDNLVAKFALIGFIFFISCDICTGVSYLSTNGTLSTFLIAPANYLAWFFYYPSQILLSNSSKYVKIKSKQKIVL